MTRSLILFTLLFTEPNCSSNYTGQTKCRLLKRVIQHNRTDKYSHLLKHSSSNDHHRVCMDDTGVKLQVELQKKDQWTSFHQRKETWPQYSKRCLHIEVIPLTSQHLDVDTIQCSPNFIIKLLMMSYGCRTKYWVFTKSFYFVILFLIKFYARKNIFDILKSK